MKTLHDEIDRTAAAMGSSRIRRSRGDRPTVIDERHHHQLYIMLPNGRFASTVRPYDTPAISIANASTTLLAISILLSEYCGFSFSFISVLENVGTL